ncbi:hypothetical protein KY316_02510 [Candidatus Woesearchaeota archaeon]|nr:hypothetical protein [Candidatus Woesearchaeota archaeon]
MALFGAKAEKKPVIPTDNVLKLRQQGMPDDQIVEMLQKDGFKSHQIFEAMSQADIKGMVAPERITDVPSPENPMQPMPSELPPLPSAGAGASVERIQEIAEAIIDEKWDVLVENVNKIVDWKESVEKEMALMKKTLEDMSTKLAKSQSAISEELEAQERKMADIDSDVKAFTKVLQKALPDLMAAGAQRERAPSAAAPKTAKPAPKGKSRTEEIFGSIEDIS